LYKETIFEPGVMQKNKHILSTVEFYVLFLCSFYLVDYIDATQRFRTIKHSQCGIYKK